MTDPASDVIEIAPGERTRAGGVLGRAFHDDPQWVALMSDSDARQKKLPMMFAGTVELTRAAGGVAERTSGFEACALWLRPGRDIGLRAVVRSGFASARWLLTPPLQNPLGMMRVLRQFDRRRAELMTVPHWYLMALGVDPAYQGEGFGSALVRAGSLRADRDRVPTYLETESELNVTFYERLGFEVIEELDLTELGLRFALMLRQPDTSR